MKINWQFYLMMAQPSLETVSRILANQDANTTGKDDKAAAFLHYAAVATAAILDDKPLPLIPESLSSLVQTTADGDAVFTNETKPLFTEQNAALAAEITPDIGGPVSHVAK